MAAGHGYGNVGDEAQCGACVQRWRSVAPGCKITLFSPSPPYTEALHNEKCEWAPRVAWFRANTDNLYFGDWENFEREFWKLRRRLIWSVELMRRGVKLSFLCPRESSVINCLLQHDILHISGGGFLTGKTRSRLWENCLLMEVCALLGIPYILTGHNIGVFEDEKDKNVARRGLLNARYIGLRDRGISENELNATGICGSHIESTCDDALLCPRADNEIVRSQILKNNGDSDKSWVAVNCHYWGQSEVDKPKFTKQFALICDHIASQLKMQVVFIAMTPTDADCANDVIKEMRQSAVKIPYCPDFRVVRGIIADSVFIFTMKHHPIVFAQGESVPVVCVALDDYYFHKNRGALDNTGHTKFLLNGEEFYGETFKNKIDQVIQQKSTITKEMRTWVEAMRKIELNPYKRVITMIGGSREPLC
ncbi:MAG TPA: hypothetical protein DDZ51_00415 [Planctomycetaceae bacterium]|nr:hypothetical protein [Planctomycetaceae bacterium]